VRIVQAMKTQTICLTTILLLAPALTAHADSAADQLTLRYTNATGKARFTVKQDISARTGKRGTEASRDFRLDLSFGGSGESAQVTILKAKATYTAHGMNQRLPVTKLNGQNLMLSVADGGRALRVSETDQDLEIPVGDIIGADYPIGLALVDLLPVFPQDSVSVGATWSTTRATRTLEGWAWAEGQLDIENRVTAIESENNHTIVSGKSMAKAQLGNAGAGLLYSGDGTLNRTSNWRFDATEGRLLSLSVEQTTSGLNSLPQGEVKIRQRTEAELTAAD
jgi:hypothetical protein